MDIDQKQILEDIEQHTNRILDLRPDKPMEITIGQNTKILRMRLINFMCHSNFSIEFNKNFNIIVGRNGSGKSAILTALTIGFGANAKRACRSTSLKHLIKNGENKSTLQIEISNDSDIPYEYEVYGKKIIIVCEIRITGARTYIIKDEFDKIIKKSREELLNITQHYNIQPDNPIFILNQEDGRNFLKNTNPRDNYSIFLKATSLSDIITLLEKSKIEHEKYMSILPICYKKAELSKMKKEEYENKYKLLHSAENLKKQLEVFELQREWLKISQLEQTCENLTEVIEELKVKNEETIQLFKDKIHAQKQLTEKQESMDKKIKQKQRDLNNAYNELLNKNKELEENKNNLKNETRYIHKYQEVSKYLTEQIAKLEQEINKRNEMDIDNTNRLIKERDEKENALNKNLIEIKQRIGNSKQELKLLCETKFKYNEQIQGFNEKWNQQSRIIRIKHNDINQMKQTSNDELSLYGSYMSSLIQTLEKAYRNGKFSEMPIGPLGRYIQVSNMKWRPLVEYILSDYLTSFIVNSTSDRSIFDKIIETQFPHAKHSIITVKFHKKVYDVSNGLVQEVKGSKCLFNVIQCSNPVVTNCLIDQIGIERILFVDDLVLAVKLTSEEENVPENLQKVIVTDPLLEYYPAPNYRVYSLYSKQPKYLQIKVKDKIKLLEENIKQIQEEMADCKNQEALTKEKLRDLMEHYNKLQSVLEKHEKEMNFMLTQLRDLKGTCTVKESQTEILHQDCNTKTLKLKDNEKLLIEKENICAKLKEIIEEQENINAEKQREMKEILNELTELKVENSNFRNEMRTLQDDEGYHQSLIKEFKKELDELQNKLSENYKRLNCLKDQVQPLGERVETNYTEEQLNACIKKFNSKLSTSKNIKENINEVKKNLELYSEKENSSSKLLSSIKEAIELLSSSVEERYKRTTSVKIGMGLRIKRTFSDILQIRGFKGELDFDHDAEKLKIIIHPREEDFNSSSSNIKSLSGGERSYGTIAFLLSLWSCLQHPFYALDEYDVFTDHFNNRIMTELLLNESRKKPDTQYILLTPQDISYIQPSSTITIHKLNDPTV